MKHVTVLQQETVLALNLKKDSVVVDCTLGSGGHAEKILATLGAQGRFIGIDVDQTALQANAGLSKRFKTPITLVEDNFRNIEKILDGLHLEKVDAIIADLGWRMEQFNGESGLPRGFSFQKDEPLAMTFGDPEAYPFTAYDIVNEWREEDIANVIYAYGEERFSRRIAKKIEASRKERPIATTFQLAEIVVAALPHVHGYRRVHPATKTFQALRIAVNDEFDALRELLDGGFACLAPHGRMAIISFHSLEDRIVKETFRTFTRDQRAVLVHKKPITASNEEQEANPRSRSAKLRTIEKIQ